MIARYTLPEMGALWSEETKFQKWLDVEIAVCEVHAELGTIPREALEQIKSRAKFSVARIDEIEKTTDHDVIAFTTNLAESIGEAARFVHYGLTSSDVVDTANALLLRDACDLLIKKVEAFADVLKRRALEFKDTPQVGRTHGIHAEPTSFGLTFALWYDEMRRNRERLMKSREAVAVGKISGAVGAFAHLDPQVEEKVCARLGLKAAPVSTQIIQRDNYAEYLCTLAIIASSLDKFALQIRHWQRTEVREVQEKFKQGQKGSSAMPHKRNPILSERICGMARVVRAYYCQPENPRLNAEALPRLPRAGVPSRPLPEDRERQGGAKRDGCSIAPPLWRGDSAGLGSFWCRCLLCGVRHLLALLADHRHGLADRDLTLSDEDLQQDA